jgi:hypothetical protein
LPLVPIATFLAGSLLSLLLPVLLLIALVVWYWVFIRRVPEPTDGAGGEPTGATTPAPPNATSAGNPPTRQR